MGNRGSKSICSFRTDIVKEQRVDGSWLIAMYKNIAINLRCTLMGCESSLRIKILSNQLNKLLFSCLLALDMQSEKGLSLFLKKTEVVKSRKAFALSAGGEPREQVKLNP